MIPNIWISFSGQFRISSWCPGSNPRLRTTFGLERIFHIYLKQLRTLSVSPYGSWICRHDGDTSPINNHQRDLEIHNGSHILNDDFVIDRTINIRNQFPLSRDTLLIRGLIVGISIPSSTSLLISTLYSFHVMSSLVTQSHACKLSRWHSTERAQSISIRHMDGQIPLLIHALQRLLSEYLMPPL